MQKKVFITGGASGIGRASARLFAAHGWTVGVLDRERAGLERLRGELGADRCRAFACDLGDTPALRGALESFCAGDVGGLDLLVNNAGVLHTGAFEELPAAAHHELLDVNARAVIDCLLLAFPLLKTAHGRVINIASASANYGTPGFATYSASKMFVRGLSQALDIEWRPHGIRVSCILPAFVATPMIAGRDGPAFRSLGAPLAPEAVAQAVWRAAHGNRLEWHLGGRYRVLRALSEPLPGGFKRALMRWLLAARA